MTEKAGDTIEVRADETFDYERLAHFLSGKLDGAGGQLEVRQFGGGAANLTYELCYAGATYVLRRPPLGPVAPSSHDMAREYKVLSVLHRAYPYAPRALLFCDDNEVIGAPFFVMERKRGIVVRRSLPECYRATEDAPRRMSEAIVDALADLHAVDYEELGLAALGRPDGFVQRQIEGWKKRWDAAKVHDLPAMDSVVDWLRRHCPAASRTALVHNDYKLDNAMLAPEDPGRVVAVFDWDMCTLGDPLCDLGALLAYWSDPEDPPHFQMVAQMPIGDARFLTRRQLVARYAQRSGCEMGDIGFYRTLGLYRLVVIAAQIYIRYHRGQTRDQRFAMLEPLIPLIAQAAEDASRETAAPV